MADTGYDDSVEKLQDFCGLLGRTSAALGAEDEALAARGDSLDETEAEARRRCGDVAARLASALDELSDTLEETGEQLDRLAETAGELGASRLSAARESLLKAQSSFEERSLRELADLDADLLELLEAEFGSLGSAIDEVEAELARVDEDTRPALEQLEQAIGEVANRTDESRARGVAALEEACRGVAEDGTNALERGVAEHEQFWRDELPEAVRAECASVAEPLEQLYLDWEDDVLSAAEDLGGQVEGWLEEAADHVTRQGGEPMAVAVAGAVDEGLAALEAREAELLSTLLEGDAACEGAAALVDDLAVARQVVGEIDRLLKAIAE